MIAKTVNNKKNFKIILTHLNILYIEDEINIRENITKTLEMFVSNVFPVGNINEAISIIENNRVDLIISDINLPGKSGIEFIKKLRENKSNIPVILLSAYTEKDYLLEATKLKLVDYLVKPIDFDILKEALIKVCEEIIENARFIVSFEDKISYNILQKRLYTVDDNTIDLTSKEIELLDYMIENNKRIISHEEIKTNIWEDSFEATDSALKNLLNKLRKKIGKSSIENVSGVGFRINLS